MMIGFVTGEGEEEGGEEGKSHCKVGTRWVRQPCGIISTNIWITQHYIDQYTDRMGTHLGTVLFKQNALFEWKGIIVSGLINFILRHA